MKTWLRITDGTESVNFFGKNAGFHLKSWTRALPPTKDGGIWQSSPFTDGRRLALRKYGNIIDPLVLVINRHTMDAVIRDTQKLRRLLEKAISYSTSEWTTEPVWIEAQGDCETNREYALIYNYETPTENNPFFEPLSAAQISAMDDWVLNLEHGIWQDTQPGQGACLPISSYNEVQFPWYISFDGAATSCDLASPAKEDNLADNAFTAEAWFYAAGWGENNAGRIFDKSGAAAQGWYLGLDSGAGGIRSIVYCAVGNADITYAWTPDSAWHHIAITWDDAADRKICMYLDGVQVAVSAAGNGAIVADAANNMFIGNRTGADRTWNGRLMKVRLSNVVRYSFPFTPPVRCQLFDTDTNTVWHGIYEGSGNNLLDMSGMAVVTGGVVTWGSGAWGYDCG